MFEWLSLFWQRPENFVRSGICPTCRKQDLHFGPQGGCSTNFACFSCSARFNGTFFEEKGRRGVLFLEHTGEITESERRFFRSQLLHEDWDFVL
jgi:hypothetical protein